MTTIIEDIDERGRRFLLDLLYSTIHGDCYHFAIALHRNLGWPIVGLISDSEIIHAGVRSPEGKIMDGRGKISESEFGERFVSPPFIIREISEKELLATGTVKEPMIELILKKAQLAWPALPWKNQTIQNRMAEFCDELEKLSRKYKLWICGQTPMSLPTVFEGFGDEKGYALKPMIDGNAFTINRRLIK